MDKLGWQSPIFSSRGQLLATLALLVLLMWSSQLWALDAAAARVHAGGHSAMFMVVILILTASQRLQHLRHTVSPTLLFSLNIFILLNSIVAISQFLRQRSIGLAILGERELMAAGGYSVIESADASLTLRAYGLSAHPNTLGGLMMICLLLLPALAITQQTKWLRVLSIIAWVCGLAALLFSFSRSAWLGTMAGSVAAGVLLLSPRNSVSTPPPTINRRRQLISTVGAGLLLLFVFSLLYSNGSLLAARLRPEAPAEVRSLSERRLLNETALALIAEQPLTGVGARNFVIAAADQLDAMPEPQPAHNVILLASAELGIVGGLLWAIIMLLPIVHSLRRWQQHPLSPLELGVVSALVAAAITDQFDMYSYQWATGIIVRWVLLACWLVVISLPVAKPTEQ